MIKLNYDSYYILVFSLETHTYLDGCTQITLCSDTFVTRNVFTDGRIYWIYEV